MSLEDFLNIEVTSVHKTRESLSRTPAAVFVINQEDIRRSGANSLPEVLRLAPGIRVARVSGTNWTISIRGFGNTYSNKLLVMIDGRTIYSPVLSGVLWNEDLVMLEDIERIEVLRGPGGTMWGANAVTGVINIVTRSSADTRGGLAAASGGSWNRAKAAIRYGGKLGRESTYRAWTQYTLNGDTTLPGVGALSPWPSARAGLRVDWNLGPHDSILVEAEAQRNNGKSATPTGFGPKPSNTEGEGPGPVAAGDVTKNNTTTGYALSRWTHTTNRGDEVAAQFYENEERVEAGFVSTAVRTLDFDIQDAIALPARQTLVIGGGARCNMIQTDGRPELSFQPANRRYMIYNAFINDEWEVVKDRLTISGGAKFERYSIAGLEAEPSARIMWTPSHNQGYWMAVSKAVRTPSHVDYAMRMPITLTGLSAPVMLTGSDAFQPEKLKAFEVGSRFQLRKRWALDLAGFSHWYTGLGGYRLTFPADNPVSVPGQPPALITATNSNALTGLNRGGEATLHYEVSSRVRVSTSYSALIERTNYMPGFTAANTYTESSHTPKHPWQARVAWDFARGWEWDAGFERAGRSAPGTGGDRGLAGYSQADCRIGRKLGEFAELSVSGHNLLRPLQREASTNFAGMVPRSVEAGIRWSF